MARKQTRSEARECAFSLIFQTSMNDEDIEFLLSAMTEENPECIDNLAYIKGAVYGVSERRDELCALIGAALPGNRDISRLSNAVLAILLLAVYEIKYVSDVPEKVAVNEAVELAKKYAEDTAAPFVNGVLSGVLTVAKG